VIIRKRILLLLFMVVSSFGISQNSPSSDSARERQRQEEVRAETERLIKRAPSVRPAHGLVPDEKTAISIAEAILYPIYGEETVKRERPFAAHLNNGVWTVIGYLPPGMMGGTAVVRVAQRDGRILFVNHFQ